jgi:hypothetical protein
MAVSTGTRETQKKMWKKWDITQKESVLKTTLQLSPQARNNTKQLEIDHQDYNLILKMRSVWHMLWLFAKNAHKPSHSPQTLKVINSFKSN